MTDLSWTIGNPLPRRHGLSKPQRTHGGIKEVVVTMKPDKNAIRAVLSHSHCGVFSDQGKFKEVEQMYKTNTSQCAWGNCYKVPYCSQGRCLRHICFYQVKHFPQTSASTKRLDLSASLSIRFHFLLPISAPWF